MPEPSGASGGPPPAPASRAGLAAVAATVFAVSLLFRFVTAQFTDDHFVHLSRAQQILLGDVPIRDFFDPGLILKYYLSAGALALSGGTLFGEAILTIVFVAAGAALVFVLATRLSGSLLLGTASTVLVVASCPRLYNYPKVFFYVLALALGWRYARRPGSGRLAALAVATAVAFLVRHDHGVYVGLMVVTMMAVQYWNRPREALRPLAGYAALTAALLLPFVVFVQLSVGLPAYVRGGMPQAQTSSRLRFNRLPIRIDRSAPLVVLRPPDGPRIHVRWARDLNEGSRRRKETQYGLASPEPMGGGTWSYVAEDTRPENLQGLVGDPEVEDTHNIDRSTFELTVRESWWTRLDRRFPVRRVARVLPGVLTAGNALAWFYYVTFVLPFVCLLVLAALAWRGRTSRPELAVVGSAILLSVVTTQALVRASPDTRLADVAGPVAVLAAWLTARWLGRGAAGRTSVRGWRAAAAGAVWLVTLWSVAADAGAPPVRSASILLSGPARTWEVITKVTRQLGRRPSDTVADARTGLPALTRYLFECTAPTDRVLVTFFKPELFFFAERGFAGGQVYLHPGWHASPADQRLTVERLERQRVPIVLALPPVPGPVVDEDDPAIVFPLKFPLVYEYVQRRYTVAAESRFGGAQAYRVLVDTRLAPARTYAPLDLPCYR